MKNKIKAHNGKQIITNEQILDLYHKVEYTAQIATMFGISFQALNQRLRKIGLPIRRKPKGVANSRQYRVWKSIRERCRKKNCKYYDIYGGRGIDICDEWYNSFHKFIEDMGERPSDNHSIDRIDNDKGYYKENCRWATKREQNINQRPKSKKSKTPVGVSFRNKKYLSSMRVMNSFTLYIGSFETESEARKAYEDTFFEWHGKKPIW